MSDISWIRYFAVFALLIFYWGQQGVGAGGTYSPIVAPSVEK